MIEKNYALNLNSDAFNTLKNDFNQILRSTLNNMLQKEGEKAEVKISLKITLAEGMAPDLQETKYAAERETIIPKFEHKISSVMQIKDEKSGYVGGKEFELVWDKDRTNYVMRPIKSNQTNLFESMDEPEDYEYDEVIDSLGEDDDEEAKDNVEA